MAHFEPKIPLQLAPQVCFALHAAGITNDYEYHELHEFFVLVKMMLYTAETQSSLSFL